MKSKFYENFKFNRSYKLQDGRVFEERACNLGRGKKLLLQILRTDDTEISERVGIVTMAYQHRKGEIPEQVFTLRPGKVADLVDDFKKETNALMATTPAKEIDHNYSWGEAYKSVDIICNTTIQ